MDLQVTETTPLGAWISHMLRKSALVLLCRKGSKNVLIKLLMDRFQNLKDLSLGDCESVEQLLDTDVDFVATSGNFVFPLLELESLGRLSLWNDNITFAQLGRLDVRRCGSLQYLFSVSLAGSSFKHIDVTVACSYDGEEEIYRRKHIGPEMKMVQVNGTFYVCQKETLTDSNPFFDGKVSCPNLEWQRLENAESITARCSHKLPTGCFSKLEMLVIWNAEKLRSLVSPSVACGVLNLRILEITLSVNGKIK
ncbi:hypothetical protein CQW23_01616 [Capsicum baccatum]|uniref:Disease resistance protein At4g27190-like leucine-rich repeats domain-containing protein n=1 Tax=Capsicum baccatum TaxID=33114 RepID=A0A2G2XP24_CAPBA|nr:hypothetical protein CQW23_01616 [Capsicum baccatum]